MQMDELKSVIEGMAAQSLRCIAFAYRPIEGSDVPVSEETSSEWHQPDDDLILMGICGIKVCAFLHDKIMMFGDSHPTCLAGFFADLK